MRAMTLLPSSPARVQVEPPSAERYTPLPQLELFRSFASPVPTHTTLASEGAMATAPIEATASFSKIPENVPPLSVVFMTPPVPSAT